MSKKFNSNMTITEAMDWFTSTGFEMAGISKRATFKDLGPLAENALINFCSKAAKCSHHTTKKILGETTLYKAFSMIKSISDQESHLQAIVTELVGGGDTKLLEIVRITAAYVTSLTIIPPNATLIDILNVYTQALCTDLNIPMTLPLAELKPYFEALPEHLAGKTTMAQALPTLYSSEIKQRLEDLVVLRKTTTPSFFMQAMSHPATQALGAILLLGGLAAAIVGIVALVCIGIILAKSAAIACVVVGAALGAAATMPFFSRRENHHTHPTEHQALVPAPGR